MKRIAVFCSSSERIDRCFFDDAEALGEAMVQRDWGLVYGGANCGLMRMLAETVEQGGGKALGVIPRRIVERGKAAQNISELVVTEDMKERKSLLREHADAFIALPGGWGTLEEIIEVISLRQLEEHHKPIVFLNTNGFYTRFFEFIAYCHQGKFISPLYDNLYIIADTVEEAIAYLEREFSAMSME